MRKKPFRYQLLIEWCDQYEMYKAFVPSLLEYSNFVPEYSPIGVGATPGKAVSAAMTQADRILSALKGLSILPPPADIVPIDSLESTSL